MHLKAGKRTELGRRKTRIGSIVMIVLAFAAFGCTSGPSGTYSDANGAVLLELKSGGKANITFMGEMADCTDSASGNQLTLDCKPPAGKIVFTIHDDGSLTGPPGGFMPMLRKQK
jgi:hypothetical protein